VAPNKSGSAAVKFRTNPDTVFTETTRNSPLPSSKPETVTVPARPGEAHRVAGELVGMTPEPTSLRRRTMRQILLAAVATFHLAAPVGAQTAVPLSTYADEKGYLDVQKLTCAQLADTYQEDADALTAWYSGWYNGLARKHFANLKRGKLVEHEIIVYCKANREKRIIEALAVVFKDERAKLGIEMK
jgi:hypothetical protein